MEEVYIITKYGTGNFEVFSSVVLVTKSKDRAFKEFEKIKQRERKDFYSDFDNIRDDIREKFEKQENSAFYDIYIEGYPIEEGELILELEKKVVI